MAQCPHLKYVGLFATGYDNVDIREAARRGIVVCNAPGYSTDSVAQHTFSLLLNLASNTVAYNASVHSGDWMRSSVFTYLKYPITEISGKKLGIVGYGAIGRAVAELGRAFGMLPLIHTRTVPAACPYPVVSFDTLLAESDFITLHCPLNDQTRHLIDAAAISKMKKTAYLINTSRRRNRGGSACRSASRRTARGRGDRRACRRADAARPSVFFRSELHYYAACRLGFDGSAPQTHNARL